MEKALALREHFIPPDRRGLIGRTLDRGMSISTSAPWTVHVILAGRHQPVDAAARLASPIPYPAEVFIDVMGTFLTQRKEKFFREANENPSLSTPR